MAGQKKTGETFNSTVSLDPRTGNYVFSFSNPFNVVVSLKNATDLIINGDGTNGRYNLQDATGTTINGSSGNDIFALSKSSGGLQDNIVKGGNGYDFITAIGTGSVVDLTQGSSGIEAVVGGKNADSMSVTVSLGQLSGSALTNGGTGRAFAAVVGTAGTVDVQEIGKFHLVGVVDAAHNGYTATGTAITGDALTALLANVTDISAIKGNLASMYAGTTSVPANETHIAGLNAYVFSDGSKYYTVWTDGSVTPTDSHGNVLDTVYQPAEATPDQAVSYGAVDVFNKDEDYAAATVSMDGNGAPVLNVSDGNTSAYAAVLLKAGTSGVTIRGDAGDNGQNWFGLGQSGGGNHIVGSKGGSLFDLQTSTELLDYLTGGSGFDIVRAAADGADLDLTKNNGNTGKAATGIEAVIGASNLNFVQSVEMDVAQVKYVTDASGVKVGVFEAMLGSTADTLTLTGAGKWIDLGTFAPGAALPEHASALVGADLLDAAFGSTKHTAENSLIGHLYEQVNAQGGAVKYLTVYTDASVDNQLIAPTVHVAAHDTVLI